MNAPRRLLDDPNADAELQELLRQSPRARSLDPLTQRRLRGRVARAAAVPMVAAGWLFVKSAAAALGVVLGTGAIAIATGVVDWSPPQEPQPVDAVVAPAAAKSPRVASTSASAPAVEVAPEPEPVPAPEPVKAAPAASFALASPSASGAGSLSVEAAILERARRELRAAPAVALSVATEHAQRFPRGQLSAERTLIQIEALHRLGRDGEARGLGRGLLSGSNAGLYAERVHQLLGENL